MYLNTYILVHIEKLPILGIRCFFSKRQSHGDKSSSFWPSCFTRPAARKLCETKSFQPLSWGETWWVTLEIWNLSIIFVGWRNLLNPYKFHVIFWVNFLNSHSRVDSWFNDWVSERSFSVTYISRGKWNGVEVTKGHIEGFQTHFPFSKEILFQGNNLMTAPEWRWCIIWYDLSLVLERTWFVWKWASSKDVRLEETMLEGKEC